MIPHAGQSPHAIALGASPFRKALILLAVAVLFGALLLLAAGEVLSRPARASLGEPPPDLMAKTVRIPVSHPIPGGGASADQQSSAQVSGWFSPGQSGRGAVLLLHGVRSHRSQMLARARLLHQAGLSVLLIDLPAHGESSGERISFAWRESQGVAAALDFLRHELPRENLGVIGVSLGGASLLLIPEAQRGPLQAVVLESVYPTITEAVSNRLSMRLGLIGRWMSPLLLSQLPLRLDVQVDQLRPIEAIKHLQAPVLVAGGLIDEQTPPEETRRLFAAAPQGHSLWLLAGAGHIDLQTFAPEDYRKTVIQFLSTTLRQAPP